MKRILRFPDPVNEVSSRLVAGGVALLAITTLVNDERWLLIPLAYGFVARVLTGPTLSPLGQLVTRVIVPRLPIEPKWVPGPPKRFAQGIGATITTTALVLQFGFGLHAAAFALVGLVLVAATLESVFAWCVGCKIFGELMRIGLIPEEVCERCNNVTRTSRHGQTVTSS